MNASKLKSSLEIVTNVAVLLVAASILFILADGFLGKYRAPSLRPGLTRGEALPALPGFEYGGAPKTLILALDTRCRYCAYSLPFYKELIEARRANPGARLVAVFPESADEVNRFVRENGLDLKAIPAASFDSLGVAGTPTLILVDGSGTIQNFWAGQLSPEAEQQVVKSST